MIFKVLVSLLLLYVGYKIVMMFRRMKSQDVRAYRVDTETSASEDLVQDPFCRTYVPKSQAYVREIDGRQHFFCSRECCEKFIAGKDNR